MAKRGNLVPVRQVNKPNTTLSFLPADEDTHLAVKAEKSVHFETEYESVSEASTTDSLKTSRGIYTLLPSENLYSGDTFTFDTQIKLSGKDSSEQTTSNPTDLSYTNTFIALESEDETRTASDISHSESLASSTVFSQPPSDGTSTETGSTKREWKDVTDIVKDIDELEESEFVTRRESFFSEDDEATDVTESEDEEMVAIQREQFLLSTIRRLKLRDVLSTRSLVADHSISVSESDIVPARKVSREEAEFCQKMINNCQNKKDGLKVSNEVARETKTRPRALEYYGLSSSIVEKLKMENLQQRLAKKSADIDKSIQESEQFIEKSKAMEAAMQQREFISQMVAQIQKDNTEDRIQAHLIKMHPVKQFAELVKELPHPSENSQEILYKYKKRLEAQRDAS